MSRSSSKPLSLHTSHSRGTAGKSAYHPDRGNDAASPLSKCDSLGIGIGIVSETASACVVGKGDRHPRTVIAGCRGDRRAACAVQGASPTWILSSYVYIINYNILTKSGVYLWLMLLPSSDVQVAAASGK